MIMLTSKEIEQIRVDLERKNIILNTIEYYERPLDENKTYTVIYVNDLYECILRKGNNRWYEKKYTTKKDSKSHKQLIISNAVSYKIIEV